jgi:hypothetical protein
MAGRLRHEGDVLIARMTGLRALHLAFQISKEVGPRLRVLPFAELSSIGEVIYDVVHVVAIVALNSINGAEGVSVAFANKDICAGQWHPTLRQALSALVK